MKEIKTETVIAAKPNEIWEILTDFASYPEWNPQIVRIEGRPELGEKLQVRVYALNGSGRQFGFTGKIIDYEIGRKLAWQGGVPGILSGYHYWELDGVGDETKITHGEKFYGLYPFFLSQAKLEAMSQSYEAANRDLEKYLRRRSEA